MRTNVLWPAGALALAGEAVVHIQQYFALFHEVRWIGPLFLANAVACAAAIAGLAYRRTRAVAALAGVAISAVALASLIVSYGEGLFGWQEAGFRPIVELTVIFEFAAVVLLSAALAAVKHRPLEPSLPRGRQSRPRGARAIPITWGFVRPEAGPMSTRRTPSTAKPAASIALSVSRAQWQPPTSRGQTPQRSKRSWTRALRGRSERTCSMKRSSAPGFSTRRSSANALAGSGTVQSTRLATAASKLAGGSGSGDAVAFPTLIRTGACCAARSARARR